MEHMGEIRMLAEDYAPIGWALCNGQLLAVADYPGLASLLGTIYGGDGVNTFGVPDLCGRIPVHQGNGYVLGEKGGVEQVQLTIDNIPSHSHMLRSSSGNGTSISPTGTYPAVDPPGAQIYSTSQNATLLQTGPGGSGEYHNNLPPFVCITFIISLNGAMPS